MNSFCRSIARKACAREQQRRLASLQSHYYATSAKARSTRPPKATDSTATTPFPPPPPPPIYTAFTPASGGPKLAPSSPPPSRAASANVEWARPSEVPFQAKVANSVHLIGYVSVPVQFQTSPDGKAWASAIISTQCPSPSSSSSFSDDSHTPPLVIPMIFEGDLAHIATSHLKQNDHVYITGQLCKEIPWLNASQGQASIQVIVENLNFVETSSHMGRTSVRNTRKENIREEDIQKEKIQEKGTFNVSDSVKRTGDDDSASSPWRDLIDNPKQWLDYRGIKLNGLVKPNFPDLKRKDGRHSIWLDRAPNWVLSQLEGLEFDVQIKNPKETKEAKEELLKDLVENPDNWWDNRVSKSKDTQPDFKHKVTGKGVWLNNSPAWVLSKLPPPKTKKDVASDGRQTLLL